MIVDFFEWMFIISGFIFFISMISALIFMVNDKKKTVLIIGVILAVLMVPIIAVLINFLIVGNKIDFIIYTILIFCYLLAEFLLDRIFKIDFRSKISLHVPYIILEYAACFSFVFGILKLDLTMGWIISIFFWGFLGVLVYYLIMQKKKKKVIPEFSND
ncbi:MAG: hypothetical protein ACFFKA_17655 [Candidatus Thorarchaeota archaeon]